MKKADLKNILIISFLIVSLVTGVFNYSVRCESEECCKTDCCEENSASADLDCNLIFSNSDCCVYNQSIENKINATISHNSKINITSPSILIYKVIKGSDFNYSFHEPSSNLIRESHSISVLRI